MFTKIIHLPGENFYTQVPNHWLRDHRLSGVAKALMGYWQSHEIGYRVSIEQTIAEFREGKDAIYAAVKLLRDTGYLVLMQDRGERGKFGSVEYTLGPAAFEQQYTRRWGTQADASVSPGYTASGFPGSGPAGSGSAASGGSDTKKNNPKKNNLEEEQDQRNSLSAPADGAADSVADSSERPSAEREDLEQRMNPKDPKTEAAIGRMLTLAKETRGWPWSRCRAEIKTAIEDWGDVDLVEQAWARCLADPLTTSPARFNKHDAWWTPQSGVPAQRERETRPEWCGECESYDRTLVVLGEGGREAIKKCPKCHPAVVRAAGQAARAAAR